jgi:hypothetical protein
MNIGFFGSDLDLLKTNWITEYTGETKLLGNRASECNLWNYELAPNKTKNIVSKHSIVSSNSIQCLNNDDKFFSHTFYYHFNQ